MSIRIVLVASLGVVLLVSLLLPCSVWRLQTKSIACKKETSNLASHKCTIIDQQCRQSLIQKATWDLLITWSLFFWGPSSSEK